MLGKLTEQFEATSATYAETQVHCEMLHLW